MAAKLVAEEGNLKGLVLSLENNEQWIIGRDPDACQLIIEDPVASRKHLICRSTPEGIVAENLSTTNPVQINSEDVTEPRLLQNGDLVKIGSGTYRFYTESEAQVIDDKEEPHVPAESAISESPAEAVAADPQEEGHSDSIFDEEAEEHQQVLANINFDLMETGRWLLKVIGGPNNGAEFAMQPGNTYIIGTDPNTCDIIFHDTSVSRQHARITIDNEERLFIEDLKSKNGTLIDAAPLQGKQPLPPNTVITMGTTSFVVFDREGEMQTIISPILPSIVKVLQEKEAQEKERETPAAPAAAPQPIAEPQKKEHSKTQMSAFILIAMLLGLFVLVGVGATTLFTEQTIVVKNEQDTTKILGDALAPFTGVRYSYNNNTGTLLMVGHVLTDTAKKQLLYNLQGMKFIKNIDDTGIVIDELVWQEYNSLLAKNPSWRGISIQAPSAGHFALTGSLKTRDDMEKLMDYLSVNFPYLDQLENKVVVEEDVISSVDLALKNHGINSVKVEMAGSSLTLRGGIPQDKVAAFDALLDEFKAIPGVRKVQDFVTEVEPERSMINISDRYEVSGISSAGGANLSVVVDGKILTRGDVLDGMRITSIKSNAIFLEKDGVKYRIDIH